MKKTMLLCAPAIVLILLLAGCSCKHEWQAATCTAPKTCSLCGETEGKLLPHTWEDATCTNAKTCAVCKSTEGEALPHTWQDATCTNAKICTVCETTEGNPLGHVWQDATCTTPKTCSVCQATEGKTSEHTWQNATCMTPKTCAVCQETEGEVAAHKWTGATCVKAGICSVCGKTGEKAAHKWTGATCTKAGVCSVCNATGKKTDHKYKITSDRKPTKTFAAKRVKQCETCGNEKTEYLTQKYTYDLASIRNTVASYAKKKGFKVSFEKADSIDYNYSGSVLELDTPSWGPDKIISVGKNFINYCYEEYSGTPAASSAYTIHINVYYSQNGALGGGFFGVSVGVS